MVTTTTTVWRGASGQIYTYNVYPIGTPLAAVPGNYVWAVRAPTATGGYRALYAGEAKSLAARVTPSHERFPCVQRHGATHITARVNRAGPRARELEEEDIRHGEKPPCNRQ